MQNIKPRKSYKAEDEKPAVSPRTSSAKSSFPHIDSPDRRHEYISNLAGSSPRPESTRGISLHSREKVLDSKDQEHLEVTASQPAGSSLSPVASSAQGLLADTRRSPKLTVPGSTEVEEDRIYPRLEDSSVYPDLTYLRGEDEPDVRKRKGGPKTAPYKETSPNQVKSSSVNNADERKSANGFRSAFGWAGAIFFIVGLLLISAAAFPIYKHLLAGPTEKLAPSPPIGFDYTDARIMYQKEIKSLYKQHLDQEKTFWAKVLSGIDAINEESLVPHILLITGKPEARQKVEILAKGLHSSFAKAMKKMPCPPLSGRDFQDRYSGDRFFDSVENCLRDRSILIEGIDDLHGAVAMHLHSFADNENAPFKTSAIFMTVISNCEKTLEKCVKDLVMNKWGEEVEEDKISSLNSRIFNLVVRVR